jgi:DNA-binding NtrC family response regulator
MTTIKILVIADDPDRVLSRRCRTENPGCEFIFTSRIEIARQAIAQGDLDLVVTQLILGGGSGATGLDVVRLTRKLSPGTVAVVVLEPDEWSFAQGLAQAGVHECIDRPLMTADLVQVQRIRLARRPLAPSERLAV